MKKKTIALVMAVVLLMVATVGGTLAWLTDKTDVVTNTFTTSNIGIELTETMNTDTNGDNVNDKWQAQMIPGYSYTKDPKVTVKANSVDCYLFVEFDETGVTTTTKDGSTFNYFDYTSTLSKTDSGWTKGTGAGGNDVPTNVWYREVTSSTVDQSWELLEGNKVKVNEDLTKELMPNSNATLTYTAYACQLYKEAGTKFDPGVAWTKAKPATVSGS